MSHGENLAIFRGRLKFKSNVQKIWGVLVLLAIITIVEVFLGITRPALFEEHHFLGMKWLNWIFITLTLVKGYYIAWDFMHLRDEKNSLRRAVIWTPVFLASYLIFILLFEADYVHNVLFQSGYVKWNF